MTSTCDRWLRFLFAGVLRRSSALGLSAARAQGFGPDPYKPFNSQYEQYVYPIVPETGGAVRGGRNMSRGENQFQEYLKELQGVDRLSSERFGAGVPHWKVRTDIELDKRDMLRRRLARSTQDPLASITQRYLAYFTEESPERRAMLLREELRGRAADDRSALGPQGEDADGPAGAAELGRRGRREAGGVAGGSGRSGVVSSLRARRIWTKKSPAAVFRHGPRFLGSRVGQPELSGGRAMCSIARGERANPSRAPAERAPAAG